MIERWPDTSCGSCPMVMLWHELPDRAADSTKRGGSSHVDWMIAFEPEANSALLSFRLLRPLTALRAGEAAMAEHIQDHRPAYLDYEGPVSGDRGTVSRIACGELIECRTNDPSTIELDLCWRIAQDVTEEMMVALTAEGEPGVYRVLRRVSRPKRGAGASSRRSG